MRAEVVDRGYEAFFAAHVEEFAGFLTGVLGTEADVRGGRAGVADALQEAMLRILREWGDLEQADDEERARRLYRCLRDAAGEALRREHGRRGARRQRPRVLAYDFGALEADGESLEPRERELTVAVLGAMVRDIADVESAVERRVLVDRGVLLAGLRALSEREAVVMIAVDRLGWDQRELADRVGVDFARLRETLFNARKLFHGVVRHAVGIEIEDEERARLHAYRAGELVGRERRLARRHILHCEACQALLREQHVFTQSAQQLLAPLPFVTAAHVLTRPVPVKAGAVGASAGVGLLGQAGAAKALATTAVALGVGFGVNAWLSIDAAHDSRPLGKISAPRAPSLLSAALSARASRAAAPAASRNKPKTHSPAGAKSRTHANSRRQSSNRSSGAVTPSRSVVSSHTPRRANVRAPVRPESRSRPAGSTLSSTDSGATPTLLSDEFSFEGR